MIRTETISKGNSTAWKDRPTTKLRTITYNDEAAPWSRSNLPKGLLPSSDDSDNNFSGTLQNQN
jgi:hypothetical protein